MLSPIVHVFTLRALDTTEKNTILRPFLRWVGGKQRMLPALLERMPKKFNGRYFEPFLGGGSLFLANRFKNAVLSDLNRHLINAYTWVRDDPREIHIQLSKHLGNLERGQAAYYYDLRATFNEQMDIYDLDQAARFIFLIHSNYNGMYRVNLSGKYNVPYGHKVNPCIPNLDHLIAVSTRLRTQRVKLVHDSYEKVLARVREGDFVYLDPPYPVLSATANFTSYTDRGFPLPEQRTLSDVAHQLHHKGAYVMLSIADVPLIRQLYPTWYFHSTRLKRNVSAKRPALIATELIITNYNSWAI